ncbi:MAG: Mth938-like domain-containing protein [Alphaproteobacteria bacterium]|nr:Mth938-like domain-containing protein [Alphaproteobacteria bacterium]
MDVTPLVAKGQQIIQSYAGGTFRISGVSYEEAVLVFPHETFLWSGVEEFQDLTFQSFEPLLSQADGIDVVLLGTGKTMQFFSPKLRQELSAQGLVIDVMDTGAACRTYNVLMAEGRRVAAALLPA